MVGYCQRWHSQLDSAGNQLVDSGCAVQQAVFRVYMQVDKGIHRFPSPFSSILKQLFASLFSIIAESAREKEK
jgi:hypothetical protein